MRCARIIATLVAGIVLATAAHAGLSGTYAIKPDGSGDFRYLYEAASALADSGLSGDCVLELYGDTAPYGADFIQSPGASVWTTTIRPGPGQHPTCDDFIEIQEFHNLKVEGLTFFGYGLKLEDCSGFRLSHCRLSAVDPGLLLEDCSFDTLDGNRIMPSAELSRGGVTVHGGHDHVLVNNFISGAENGVGWDWPLVYVYNSGNPKFCHNTIRRFPIEVRRSPVFCIEDVSSAEVLNNVFMLARPADTTSPCVGIVVVDSLTLDYNCYYIESLGRIGLFTEVPYLRDWPEWQALGFESHGLNTDPRVRDTSDFHLLAGSPCIGVGTSSAGIATDIDGDPRDPLHPDIGADEYIGGAVTEETQPVSPLVSLPTIVRGSLFLPAVTGGRSPVSATLLDATGRRVANLHPGPNDVSRFAPGVYFIRVASGVERDASGVSRVVVAK